MTTFDGNKRLLGLKYPEKISGIFEAHRITIDGVYQTLPSGGYEIIERYSGCVQSSGTAGSQYGVTLIREHTLKELVEMGVENALKGRYNERV